MIELRDVCKRYGQRLVVDHVSVTFREGRVTSIIGPNGAGKSTLLSVASRLIPKDGGEVLVDGREIGRWETQALARRLAVLRQSATVSLRLTVRDLVGFGRFPHSGGRLTERDREPIERALRWMELEPLQDRYLDQLSGGERQRALLAMVMAQETDYILLDEPLNNLDIRHAVQIMRRIRRMADEMGKTIVLVLHDLNFAAAYSDEIVAMKAGRVVQTGTASEVIRPDVLHEVYDMPIQTVPLQGRQVCVYFW
ncbi:MAG TPA: ATP-binding cassette domain-containing protein [Limnochordales bacterium]|uniref:ATP-binding cassette domain-containing protein n=1 Tax=Geochorda subterranea TaxID=3109564 RepID=A0ABZ1BP11_9FIRM|nr:ATP-binding cassette domain-containing protein [Limnochorda sp. LNt]NLG68626.1 ATP-binding cassette domain-containing protein [Bacillota bacterium]WRP14298.1 ATP-binding cassette domain-containing protein [Limnochorda sp. LNt]